MPSRRAPSGRVRSVIERSWLSLWRGARGFYRSDNLTYAASIAYYALLSLFPCAIVSFAVLGAVTADERVRHDVLDFVLRYFPSQFQFITQQLDAFGANRVGFGIAGTVALVWGSLGFFGALSTAVNHAWRVERSRSYWRHQWFSFLMLLVAGALLVAAVLLVSVSQMVGATGFASVLSQFPSLMVLRSLALRNATTGMFVLVVGLIFYFVPNTAVRFRDVWVGAFLTGLLWKGATFVLAWYMRDMTRFTQVNGSIAAVVVFLVWVYAQAVILLYGVEFTAAYARLSRSVADETTTARRAPH